MKKKVQKIEKKKKKNPYFEEIMNGLNDALEFERGNKTLRTSVVRVATVKKGNASEIVKLV